MIIATADDIDRARSALRVYCPACRAVAGDPCRPHDGTSPALGVHDERIAFLDQIEDERACRRDPYPTDPLESPQRVTRHHGRLRSS